MKVDILFDGSKLLYKGEPLVSTLVVEKRNDLGQVTNVIEVVPHTLAYRSYSLLYNVDGTPYTTTSGHQKENPIMFGNFEDPGKYSIREKGRVQFFSKDRLIKAAKDRNREARMIDRREEALENYLGEVKEGRWDHVHWWAEGYSFPDHSLITWPDAAGQGSVIVHPGVGPEGSLADSWGGKRPDSVWVPEDAPNWARSRLDKAMTMLRKVESVEQLSLLPEKGEISPILTLAGDEGLNIYRTVELNLK